MFHKFSSDTDKLLDLLNENEKRISSTRCFSEISKYQPLGAQTAKKLTSISIKYITQDTIEGIASGVKNAIFNGYHQYIAVLSSALTVMEISKIKNHFKNLGYEVNLKFDDVAKISIYWG